jgi:hypothetical protein
MAASNSSRLDEQDDGGKAASFNKQYSRKIYWYIRQANLQWESKDIFGCDVP